MKKILLIIAIAFCIFQMVVLAESIDIGMAASDRALTRSAGQTRIDKNHLATGTGKITLIEIWANTDLVGAEVATCFIVSGNNYSTRDTHTIGAVTSGSKQQFEVDLDVVVGDAIAIYWTGGKMEYDPGGTACYAFGDQIPCEDVAFTPSAATYSVYGTGATVEVEANVIWFGTNL